MVTEYTISNDQKQALPRLIGSMKKSEKRLFKLLAARQGKETPLFILLFDCIEKHGNPDDRYILECVPGITKQQLPNQKIFLYYYILKCLDFSSASDSRVAEIGGLIASCRILYDKCLYNDCLRMVDKTRKLAFEYGLSLQMLEVLEIEKQAIRHSISLDHLKRTEQNVVRTVHALYEGELSSRFHDFAVSLNVNYIRHGFPRNAKEMNEVKQYFKEFLPVHDPRKLDVTSAMYSGYAMTSYYLYIQDYRNSFRHASKWMKVFEDNPHLQTEFTEMYIRALNTMLVVLNKLNERERFSEIHKTLVGLKRRNDFRLTENLKLNLFKAIYIHEINYHFMVGEFRSGTRSVGRLEKELERFIPFLDHHSLLLFYYKIACLYLGAGNYRKCLVWLGRITLGKDMNIRADLQTFARILSLICHYELEDHRLVESNLRSLYRYLLKTDDFSAYNKLILSFIRKLVTTVPGEKMTKQFSSLRSNLLPLTKQRYERRAFYYFDIISWLESKIENKSVEEVVKRKLRH